MAFIVLVLRNAGYEMGLGVGYGVIDGRAGGVDAEILFS
jgi:hypothetical protein